MELPPKEKKCHHTGFEKSCRALVAEGSCDRWKFHPGPSPFKFDKKPSEWGCLDDMLWYVAGDAAQQADGSHRATTVMREMIFNPDFRNRQLSAEAEAKQIEDKTE